MVIKAEGYLSPRFLAARDQEKIILVLKFERARLVVEDYPPMKLSVTVYESVFVRIRQEHQTLSETRVL